MSLVFNYNAWVWVPDEEAKFIPGRVLEPFKAGSPGRVMVDGEEQVLPVAVTKELMRMDEQSNTKVPNMVLLKELNEAAILHNLRIRFNDNDIYTNVGTILVSVNPFKLLKLYTAEVLEQYRDKGYRNMPPHVYGIADIAYSNMTGSYKNQSCIVSGESGAGKTEATKIFLQYIADVSANASKQKKAEGNDAGNRSSKNVSKDKASLQEQILKANPLMEAFGNAKTVRNNNSSRFGKWIEVKFNNKKGTVIGGQIIQYLLEKSRLVAQQAHERNYHIFYNLCAGAMMDPEVKNRFRISDPRDYHYLNQGEDSITVDGINDERDWEDVLGSMEVMGISLQEQDDILRTLAGILHLGNIVFEKGGSSFEDASQVQNKDMLELAANQFGTTPEALEEALVSRQISVREKTSKLHNVAEAVDTRDALAKSLYAHLFDWLITRINVSLAKNSETANNLGIKPQDVSTIGVLDIFGFESFVDNYFEQVCINYCNEKLQFHFNDHIFKLEQSLYTSEKIDVSHIIFKDNLPTIDLFENKKAGIFAILDEEMFLPSGSDDGFLKRITKAQDGHPNFRKPGIKTNKERNSFTVIHYAGPVMYEVTAILDKNRDKLWPDLEQLVLGSSIKFVSNLFESDENIAANNNKKEKGKTQAVGRKQGASLVSKFKSQLDVLMDKLSHTEPQFIRCIKPNNAKVGSVFESELVLEQLRYAGLLEVCRIRQVGYPIRKDFKEFLFRYSCLVNEKMKTSGDLKAHVKALGGKLMQAGLLKEHEFQIGKTKMFLRNDEFNRLESEREVALRDQAVLIQRFARGFLERVKYRRYKKIINNLRAAMKTMKIDVLRDAISDFGDLPHQGVHLGVLKEGKILLEKLEEVQRVIGLLNDAISKRDLNMLKNAVTAANQVKQNLGASFSHGDLQTAMKKASELIERIELEKKAINELKNAINMRDLAMLSSALKNLTEMGLGDVKEAQQAEILRARLEEEERVIRNIEHAMAEKSLDRLRDAVNAASDIGMDDFPKVIEGNKMIEELLQQVESGRQEEIRAEELRKKEDHRKKMDEQVGQIRQELLEAAKNEKFDKIDDLKTKALELGIRKEEIDEIMKEVNSLEQMKENISALEAALNTMRTVKVKKTGIELDDVSLLTDAIRKARKDGMSENNYVMKQAIEMESNMKKQVQVQAELQAAIGRKDFDTLRTAVDHADDLNLDLDILLQARELMKEKAVDRPVSYTQPEPINDDQFEKQREQNFEMAKHDRYDFTKFYKIRSAGEYAKGIFFNKKKVADSMLSYSKNVIPRSILELKTKELNKKAVSINKSLLGYCGEQLMAFPATLAQDILIKGLDDRELVDEIYIQLCKHLTDNYKPESVGRAWQLMCMAVGTFPPSGDFEYYLLNFLISHRDVPGLVGNYAQYSLRRLEGMLIRGSSGFVPSIDEILAYKERPPVLTTIELVDGTHLTENLPVPPDLNVDRVIEICKHFLNLKDPRSSQFGIYVHEEEIEKDPFPSNGHPSSVYTAMRSVNYQHYDNMANESDGMFDLPPPPPLFEEEKTPPKTPQPLRGKDYIGDVVVQSTRQNVKHTFVFKKKLFIPGESEKSDDNVYSRLIYLQAADEMINGNVIIEKEADVLYLVALAIKIDTDEGFPTTEAELLKMDIMDYIPANWASTKRSPENWARALLPQRGKLVKKENAELEAIFVSIVKDAPMWGMNFFFVRKESEGNDMICAVSYVGLHFFSVKRKELQKFRYDELDRWGGSSQQFWMLVWDESKSKKVKLILYTSQARDISNLILDYAKLRQIDESDGKKPGKKHF